MVTVSSVVDVVVTSTHVVLHEVFDPSPISGRQLHNVTLESPLGGIASYWLRCSARDRFIMRADPRRGALIWHFPSDIGVDCTDQLVV